MLLPKIAVEPEIGLILRVWLGCRPDIVVRAGNVRQGVMLKNLESERVQPIRRNRVVWELRSRRGRRIENRLREDSLSLRQSWNNAEACNARPQSGTLPVREEKRLVLLNRSADRRTVLIAAEFRLRARLREQVPRVQSFIAEELE